MPPRRPSSRLRLRVRSVDDLSDAGSGENGDGEPVLPWYTAGFVAGLGAALVGWLLICAVVLLGWLSARAGGLGDAFAAGTQFWLLANGAGLALGDHRWTLAPLTLTLMLGYIVYLAGTVAARQAQLADAEDPEMLDAEARRHGVRNVTLVTAAGYVVPVLLVAAVTGAGSQLSRALLLTSLLAVTAGYLGAAKTYLHRPMASWPAWARVVPSAMKAALAVMVLAGSAVVATGVLMRAERVTELAAELGADGGSGLVLLFAQLMYLPDLILWGASWALGAGFQIGADSVIAPAATEVGLMPAIPVLGALPGQGGGSRWLLVWLLSGVLAGAAAAGIVLRRRPLARFDETALVGGLSGVLAAWAFTALAATSTGGLGSGRLSVMGPRLLELWVLGSALMGLSGMAVGLVWGLARRNLAEQATLPAWNDAEDASTTSDPDDPVSDPDDPEVAGDAGEFDAETGTLAGEATASDPGDEVTEELTEVGSAAPQAEPVGSDRVDLGESADSDEERTEVLTEDAPRRRWWRFGR